MLRGVPHGSWRSRAASVTALPHNPSVLHSTPPHRPPLCPHTWYTGYLPSFWIKLRLLNVPAANSAAIAARIPAILGGPPALTVGMVAAFVAVSCIIAADTGAYFCGKSFGRTKLTSVSPKKTVEGAVGGLLSSIAVALGLYKVGGCAAVALGDLGGWLCGWVGQVGWTGCGEPARRPSHPSACPSPTHPPCTFPPSPGCQVAAWPASSLDAAAFGTIVFFASLMGDLIESVIKVGGGCVCRGWWWWWGGCKRKKPRRLALLGDAHPRYPSPTHPPTLSLSLPLQRPPA